MSIRMNNRTIKIIIAGLFALLVKTGMAQDNTYHSVLSDHTWYRLSVTKEGIYKLDYATSDVMARVPCPSWQP